MQSATISPFVGTVPQDQVEHLRDELELLSYVTSHDLQAPLRAIHYCYEELKTNRLANDDTLQMLEQETSRLKILLQGMLDYIRLETFVTTNTAMDSNEPVQAALSILQEEIQASHAHITVGELPRISGHRGRLTRLFTYLLENALAFRGEDAPIIHISAKRQKNMWEFCVEDHGIGIAEEHREIIFRLFQRLHTSTAYPGHGVGLALARKIAEAHGGKMWVEPAPQKGSRFLFTLPDAA